MEAALNASLNSAASSAYAWAFAYYGPFVNCLIIDSASCFNRFYSFLSFLRSRLSRPSFVSSAMSSASLTSMSVVARELLLDVLSLVAPSRFYLSSFFYLILAF